jgi:hypothetical protein
MHQLLIAELHRVGYDEFMRRTGQRRGGRRRRRIRQPRRGE